MIEPVVQAEGESAVAHAAELLQAVSAAAVTLHQSTESVVAVCEAARQTIVGLGLRGVLTLVSSDGAHLVVRAVALPHQLQASLSDLEAASGMHAEGFALPLERAPELERVLQTGLAAYIEDISPLLTRVLPASAREVEGRVIEGPASQPAIFAPLSRRGTVFGLLHVVGAGLTPGNVPAIQILADHIAAALNHANRVAEIRESEERYRQLIVSSPDPILVQSQAGIMFLNPAAASLLGAGSVRQVMGRSLAEFAHEASRDLFQRLLNGMLAGQSRALVQGRLVRLDGHVFDAEASANSMVLQGRRVARLVIHDVTERRRADAVRAATVRISEAAHSAHQLVDLYRRIHRIVGELMQAKNFFIALYDEVSGTLSYPYAADERDTDWRSHRMGRGLTAYVIRTGHSLLATPEVFADMIQRGEVVLVGAPSVDWLGVPLRAAGKVVGAVVVQTYSEEVRLTEDDQHVLEFVSTQVAMAIERRRAEEEVKRRDAILEAIAYAAEQFLQRPSWEAAIQGVLERLGRAADVSRMYLFENMTTPQGQLMAMRRFEWVAPGIEPQLRNPKLLRLEYAADGFGRWPDVLGQGQACYGHVREFPSSEQPLLNELGIRSVALVSVSAGSEWWGILGCDECLRERDWSAAEVGALQAAANTLGTAIHHETAELELLRRTAESSMLYDTARDLAGPEDLPALLHTIVERAVRLMGASAGDLYLYDPDRQDLALFTSTDPNIPPNLSLKLGEGLAGRVAQTRRPQAVADYSQWEHRVRSLEAARARAAIEVPVLYGGALVGVLGLHEVGVVDRQFTEADARLLSLIAALAAGAIHNARLLDATRRHLGELEAVSQVSTAMRSAQNLEQIVQALLGQVLTALNTEHGSIWLFDPATEELWRGAARGWFALTPEAELQPGEGIAGQVFVTGQPYFTQDFAQDPNLREGARGQVPPGFGGACFPFRTAAEAIVGGMFVAVQQPRELSQDDIHLLTTVSDIAANAIQRSRLHEETERRLQRLTALHSVEIAVSASLDLHVTLNVLLDHVTTQLGVDAADVLLFNAVNQSLEYSAGRGFRTSGAQSVRLRLGEGYAGRAALERRPVHVPELRSRHTDSLRSPLYAAEGFAVMMVLPLVSKGRVVGVLEIFHRSPLAPDPEWREFLETLAQQAAVAIDSAEMLADLQRSNVELSLAYDITLEGWAHALELRDAETEGHTRRVVDLAERLGREMGLIETELGHLRRGALLHDIGKVGIPDSILRKPGPLTPEEWEVMRMHPVYAYNLLSPIAYLRNALDIPYCHHEWWDGSGYPRGLKGEDIPLAARIFAVVDTWDALLSDRPYRSAWPREKVRQYVEDQAGTQLDPQVVAAFLAMQ